MRTLIKVCFMALAVLLAAMPLLACGGAEAPTPTPAPTPSPAPTPTPPPPHEEVTLRFYTVSRVSYVHILSVGLAEITKKAHPWLRLEPIEAMGTSSNIGILQKEPERRTDTIIFGNSYSNDDAIHVRPPFTEPYNDLRCIATFGTAILDAYTTDPTIKTMADMKGHSADFSPAGATPGKLFPAMLEVLGIRDQVKVSNSGWNEMKDAFIDGLVDVAVGSGSGYPTTGFYPSAHTVEAYAARKPTYIYFSQELLNEAALALGYKVFPYGVMAPGAWLDDYLEEFPYAAHDNGWWCDKSLDEEIVYELTKTIVENVDQFGAYYETGKFMNRSNIAWAPITPELFHPGALRYYREQGIPVGFEADVGLDVTPIAK